ncbi:hypothetical protein EV361DRAFT_646977 [Lentinula raphanica]|nr:hypothetical protein C8R42DRAFT_675602 [Lentinula raphanica]KAJ3771527.1 hypothetical protein FB446DRAFT_739978 [Lentinula raphanica]KAJ3974383.1 hypothetical protein EV361DRAFT_646977 [Lentinula raphanica]
MAPSKAERAEKEQILSSLSNKLFCDFLDDFIMDIALEAHAEVFKSRAVCEICGTRCNAAHVPVSLSQRTQTSSSRAETPSVVEGSTNTPNSGKGADGTIHLECVNCQRMVASNRYAPHLSNCMGLNSSRRGAVRGSTKTKQPSDAGRSGSPASEAGYISEDGKAQKGKGKSKTKRADEAEFNLKRKRPLSPQVSPSKKQRQKGSPASRVKSDMDGISSTSSIPTTNSQSKIPSKLRDSSLASFNDRESSGSSRESSPDASLSSTLSSSFMNKGMVSRPKPVPLKQPSPPRPPPPVPAYIEDDEGDETGSSTDTSDSG